MRDISNDLGVVPAIAPATHSTTKTGDPIDLLGFGSAAFVVNAGIISGDGDFTPTVQHSDTTTGGDFEDVDAADLVGTFPVILAANTVAKVSYIGARRYVRLVLTKNGGTSVTAGAIVIMGDAHSRPVA